jgi:hypothetical protein
MTVVFCPGAQSEESGQGNARLYPEETIGILPPISASRQHGERGQLVAERRMKRNDDGTYYTSRAGKRLLLKREKADSFSTSHTGNLQVAGQQWPAAARQRLDPGYQ